MKFEVKKKKLYILYLRGYYFDMEIRTYHQDCIRIE